MKKIFNLISICTIFLCLNACDSSTAPEDVDPLVGEWTMTGMGVVVDGVTVSIEADDDNNMLLIFNSDGNYSGTGEFEGDDSSGSGTWNSTENTITLITVDGDDSETSIFDYSFSDSNNALTLSQSDTEDGVTTQIELYFSRN